MVQRAQVQFAHRRFQNYNNEEDSLLRTFPIKISSCHNIVLEFKERLFMWMLL